MKENNCEDGSMSTKVKTVKFSSTDVPQNKYL